MDKKTLYAASYAFARTCIAWPFARLVRYRGPVLRNLPEPFIVIPNHTMDLDFLLVMRSFPRKMSFVIGETIFQNRLLRPVLTKLHDPIIIRKGGVNLQAVVEILSRLRSGHNVCLFAEGNTCFDGVTGPIPPGTARMVRMSGASLVTFRVHGGYLTQPRWGRGLRRGRTWGQLGEVYTPKQLKGMTDEQLDAAMQQQLHVDAAQDQQQRPVAYRGRNRAQGLENALYLCASCQAIGSLRGAGDQLTCTACGAGAIYTQEGALAGDFPHQQLRDWVAWQRQTLVDMSAEIGFALTDDNYVLSQVDEQHGLEELARGTLRMDWQGLSVGPWSMPLEDVRGLAIYRKNRLLMTDRKGNHYDFNSDHPGSALKYRDLLEIYRHKEG